jgi:circadian clock protein KaiB
MQKRKGCQDKICSKVACYWPDCNSQLAIQKLKKILSKPRLDRKYALEIIDILEHPDLADEENNIATQVLIKTLPPPLNTIIRDLNNKEKVLMLGLDVVELNKESIK